jgi:hypothetical protein
MSGRPQAALTLLRAVFVVAFAACAGWVALANGSVNDEFAAHVTGGWLYLTTGRFAGGVHNPPLGQLWVALPAVMSGLPLRPFTDAAPVLPRLANVLLASLVVLFVGCRAARRFGEPAACLATITLVASPDYLANAALATLDLPITALMVLASMAWLDALRDGRQRRWVSVGLLTGAALATKITALLLLPMYAVMAAVLAMSPACGRLRRRQRGPARQHLRRVLINCALAILIAWGAIWASYGFRATQGTSSMLAAVPRPFSLILPAEFIDQLRGKLIYATGGNVASFAGEKRVGGWWWYYPVVFALKTPLPLLVLWLMGCGAAMASRRSVLRALAGAAVTFFVLACFNRAQIGVRHLLPVVPLLALTTAALAGAVRRRLRLVAWVLGGAALLNTAWFLPFPLTAENLVLAGNGYRIFADANYDWGQANAAIRAACSRGHAVQPEPYVATTGTLVVRVNHLQGFRAPTEMGYAWMRTMRPVRRIAGAGLVFEVAVHDLPTTSSQPDVAIAALLGEAGRTGWQQVAPVVEGVLESLDASRRNEAAAQWMRIVERQASALDAYRVARRFSLRWPDMPQAIAARDRLGVIVEAEKFAHTDVARSAFARANAAWLEGDARAAVRWVRQARQAGAPAGACAALAYRAACALGWWRTAAALARDVPAPQRRELAPSPAVVAHLAEATAGTRELVEAALWCYREKCWATSAELLARALELDPSCAPAVDLLGELVVRYKEETLELSARDRCALESLCVRPAAESR